MNGELLGRTMTTHIIALGGSLLRPEEAEKRVQWFGQLRQMAVLLEGNDRKLGFVIGGGLPARELLNWQKPMLQILTDWILWVSQQQDSMQQLFNRL